MQIHLTSLDIPVARRIRTAEIMPGAVISKHKTDLLYNTHVQQPEPCYPLYNTGPQRQHIDAVHYSNRLALAHGQFKWLSLTTTSTGACCRQKSAGNKCNPNTQLVN